ncbi:hypothetical protein [Streptomyces sp. NPDC056600]|uniref:hypothetical protein n=1 Tax=Streptomyces sp. NPDC056600 TaxID=3345874 RepID=UPI0036784825
MSGKSEVFAFASIPELRLLKEFEEGLGRRVYYASGFEAAEASAADELCTWSEDPEFLDRFLPFGMANGSGSGYALWRCDGREDLGSLPVVLVGDEGDLYVVARNLRELFQLLALDREPYGEYGFLAPGDADEEHRQAHQEFVTWLNETFGLGPVADVDAQWAARKEHDDRFQAWASRFVEIHDG